MNGCLMNTIAPGPLPDGQCFPVMGEEVADSTVIHLNVSRGPSAIFRAVIPVVVDAIKRVLVRRALTHVVKERLEAISPSFAYRDSASAISRPIWTPLLMAPLHHRMISMIFRGFLDKPRVAVFNAAIGIPAPAGFGLTDFQVVRVDHGSVSAGTLAEKLNPVPVLLFRRNAMQDREPAKRLARKIVKFTPSHTVTSIMVSNHCEMLGNKVIDVLSSAAKPIRASKLYHSGTNGLADRKALWASMLKVMA